MLKYLVLFVVACAFAFLVGTAVGYSELPVVYKSHGSGQCVKVESEGDTLRCEDIKKDSKYELVWVR